MQEYNDVIPKLELEKARNALDEAMSEQIAALFKLRTNCNYDTFYIVAKADVDEQIENAEVIITAIESRFNDIIKDHN